MSASTAQLNTLKEMIREQLERSGHLSRSGAVRILVARGLEVSDHREQRKSQ